MTTNKDLVTLPRPRQPSFEDAHFIHLLSFINKRLLLILQREVTHANNTNPPENGSHKRLNKSLKKITSAFHKELYRDLNSSNDRKIFVVVFAGQKISWFYRFASTNIFLSALRPDSNPSFTCLSQLMGFP